MPLSPITPEIQAILDAVKPTPMEKLIGNSIADMVLNPALGNSMAMVCALMNNPRLLRDAMIIAPRRLTVETVRETSILAASPNGQRIYDPIVVPLWTDALEFIMWWHSEILLPATAVSVQYLGDMLIEALDCKALRIASWLVTLPFFTELVSGLDGRRKVFVSLFARRVHSGDSLKVRLCELVAKVLSATPAYPVPEDFVDTNGRLHLRTAGCISFGFRPESTAKFYKCFSFILAWPPLSSFWTISPMRHGRYTNHRLLDCTSRPVCIPRVLPTMRSLKSLRHIVPDGYRKSRVPCSGR